jgi:Na+-transporting methylmalonyl-CoA/oxaloacetate decarboxylase gamma subunit
MRTALVAIASIYLLRALVAVPLLVLGRGSIFLVWSSLIVLVYGIAYAAGTRRAWPALAAKAR